MTIVCGNVGEEVFGFLLEAVGDDVVVTSGVVVPVGVEGGGRAIITARVVSAGAVVFR